MFGFVGLDLSLKATGVVVMTEDGQQVYHDVIAPPAAYAQRIGLDFENDFNRVDSIALTLQEIIDREVYERFGRRGFVAMEGYAYSRSGKAGPVFTLAELGGVVKFRLVNNCGVSFPLIITAGELKKYACGKGNAGKMDVILGVSHRFGVELYHKGKVDDNLTDAWVIARMLVDVWRSAKNLPELPNLTVVHRKITAELLKRWNSNVAQPKRGSKSADEK